MGLSSPSQGVWFPHWVEVLVRVRLKDLERRAYRSAILEYLRFCKQSRQQATVESARKFMEQVEGRRRLGVSQLAAWKAALNWFFRTAKSLPPNPGWAHPSQWAGRVKRRSRHAAVSRKRLPPSPRLRRVNIEHRTSNIEHAILNEGRLKAGLQTRRLANRLRVLF
jgi:hypothetical protein